MATVGGVCPRCSAPLEESVACCEDHDADGGVCGTCDGRYAVTVGYRCTNCIFERGGALGASLLTNTELLAFLTADGDALTLTVGEDLSVVDVSEGRGPGAE